MSLPFENGKLFEPRCFRLLEPLHASLLNQKREFPGKEHLFYIRMSTATDQAHPTPTMTFTPSPLRKGGGGSVTTGRGAVARAAAPVMDGTFPRADVLQRLITILRDSARADSTRAHATIYAVSNDQPVRFRSTNFQNRSWSRFSRLLRTIPTTHTLSRVEQAMRRTYRCVL